MNVQVEHALTSSSNVLEKEKASIHEQKEIIKKYLNAILQTHEYIGLCNDFFQDSLVQKGTLGPSKNSEEKYFDIFEEYTHKEGTPIKDRPELKHLMNKKYVERIEIYYKEASSKIQEIAKGIEKMSQSYNKAQEVLNILDPALTKAYFENKGDSEDVEKLKTRIDKIEQLNAYREKHENFLKEFREKFNVYSVVSI